MSAKARHERPVKAVRARVFPAFLSQEFGLTASLSFRLRYPRQDIAIPRLAYRTFWRSLQKKFN
jgi:hypothetical protein